MGPILAFVGVEVIAALAHMGATTVVGLGSMPL